GSATYSGGTFTLTGSGADMWGTADAFRFVRQPLNGDGTIVARVASIENLQAWTKAGVMIRDGVAGGAANAAMIVSAGKGRSFQYRQTAGGLTANVAAAGTAPTWVRLVRAGKLVTASTSSDGAAWTTVGSIALTM